MDIIDIFHPLQDAAAFAAQDLARKPFDYVGMACGMAGAFFVSGYSRRVAIGWLLWIVSNGAWLLAGFKSGAIPLIVQNVYFLAMNIRGLYNGRQSAQGAQREQLA